MNKGSGCSDSSTCHSYFLSC